MSIDHYENFPVASRLCPPAIRPAVVAIYRFARTADDLADEGSASPAERLDALRRLRHGLDDIGNGQEASDPRWAHVFEPLARAVAQHRLPLPPLHALLDAFERDVGHTPYATREALLDYCRCSANPVGRLLLHLYGIEDDTSRAESDALCSALQLINFWQDMSRDHPRGRCYVPAEDAARHGWTPQTLLDAADSPRTEALVRDLVDWSEALMRQGAPLALRVPGRAGWELRLVVAGGLRIVDKIRRMKHRCLRQRPRLTLGDGPFMGWTALTLAHGAGRRAGSLR